MTSWLHSLWDTIDGISQLVMVTKWVMVVSGTLTIVGAVLLIYADKKKGDLIEQARRETEVKFDQQQKEHRAKISDLSQQLSESQKLQEEAQKKLSAVEAKQAWRNLTLAQKEILKEALSPYKGQRLVFVIASPDPETQAYARQFLSIFEEAGWMIERNEAPATNKIPIGIEVLIRDPNQIPPAAAALMGAFRRAQIPAKDFSNPNVTDIRMEIGAKPN